MKPEKLLILSYPIQPVLANSSHVYYWNMVEDPKTGWLIPGQGSQSVGMGREAYLNSRTVRLTFEEGSDRFGYSLEKLCFEDPDNELKTSTRKIQAAVFTQTLATRRFLAEQGVALPEALAGHSAGKVIAASLAGAITDGFRAIAKRGEIMEEEDLKARTDHEERGVGLLLGFDQKAIEAKLAELGQTVDSVKITVINAALQFLAGGKRAQVEAFLASFNSPKKATLYENASLSHHPLLTDAQASFNEWLDNADIIQDPLALIVDDLPNNDSRSNLLKTAADVRAAFMDHLIRPINFAASIRALQEDLLVKRVIEVGPGEILSKLVKRQAAGLEVYKTNTWEELVKVVRLFRPDYQPDLGQAITGYN